MLQDLQKLGAQLQHKYLSTYQGQDKQLPLAFKQMVNEIDGSSIVYNDYSFVVTINLSAQKIFFPNQLWYIAACFADYYKALSEYTRIVKVDLHLTDTEIKQAKDNQDFAETLLANTILADEEKSLVAKFLSDYAWWYGGKGIERADFHISPILALCKLVNASQGYVADLCKFLAKNDKALQLLKNEISDSGIIKTLSTPLQQIFYGAPGTGKSHKVNKEIQNTPNALVFRTTFHPDSDYSTFVGAYKPTMKSADRLYSADELIDKLSEIKTLGHTYPCHKFAAKYWYSLKGLSAADIKRIVVACDFPESMTVEVGKGIAIGEEMAKHVQNDKIVYSFVPQAFLKAYVAAWQNPEQPVFLVIEEINRGNCAQIFGDIFQLLDRKEGVSEYPIKADQDIRDYLAKEFAGYDLEANILSGEELVLPANLHIWATMNTSDQSLFPIDSAFKRRWDWKYMPIHDAGENWTIALSDVEYDWWNFVEKINNVIGNMTSSEDKKLGYFFCKACNGKIDAEKFVNKVVFYLWNDVFKDYELSDKAFQDGEGKLTFNKFYTPLGDANEATIKTLMENMGVSTSDLITEIDEEAVNLSKDDLSALQQKRLDFWTQYLKYAQNNADYMQYFGGRQTPTKNYYCQFHVLQKKGYLCVVIKHKANKLFVKYETMDEQLYNTLYSHKAAIQSELGDINLTWEGKVDTRERIDIYAEHDVDFNNEQSIFNLIIDRLLRMREVFDKYLNN